MALVLVFDAQGSEMDVSGFSMDVLDYWMDAQDFHLHDLVFCSLMAVEYQGQMLAVEMETLWVRHFLYGEETWSVRGFVNVA